MHGLPGFTLRRVIRRTFHIAGTNFLLFFAAALALVELPKWGGPVLLAPAVAAVGAAEVAGTVSKPEAFAWAFALGAAPGLVAQLGLLVLTSMVVRAALGVRAAVGPGRWPACGQGCQPFRAPSS